MKHETTGTVIAAKKLWWFKVNTKPIRAHSMDGAIFPYKITVQYTVNGCTYLKKKWIKAGNPVPPIGTHFPVVCCADNPKRASVQMPSGVLQ